jgi:hypothetical protein
MSYLQFTFRPSLIPAYAQAEFLTRVFQLVLDYETLTEPAPPSPPADTLPPPTAFVPVAGDGANGETAPKKRVTKRKMSDDSLTPKTLEDMTAPELRATLGNLLGVPADSPQFRNHAKYPNKAALIAEIRRLQAEPAPAPVPEAVVTTEPVLDTASDTSSKKVRKNPWLGLTPEQHAARVLALKVAREAKKAERLAAAATAVTTDV